MQSFWTLVMILIYALWFRLFGKSMIAAQQWPDLAVSLGLAALSFYLGWVVIWDMAVQFPTYYLARLIMPLIHLIYGRWL